jgi:L-threonylcarbamoyladenylate synthase
MVGKKFMAKTTRTIVLKVNKRNADEKIKEAAEVIRRGGLVAFPTETVYGLGANALSAKAVRRIFEAKGRPIDNPIIVHIADKKQLERVARDVPPIAKKLMERFWPGPLTFVLKKKNLVPKEVTAGLETIAVRMPANEIALRLIKEAGVPIAAPSANLSGKPSPTTAKHVFDDLNGKIDCILDGGRTKIGVESTVLDVTTTPPTLLRPGGVGKEQIEELIGRIVVPIRMHSDVPKSPGTKYRHYAPHAKIIICKNEEEIAEKLCYLRKNKVKTAILRFNENPEKTAKNLFALLRKFDSQGVEVILCEPIEKIKKEGIGLAVIDRLKRAAGV